MKYCVVELNGTLETGVPPPLVCPGAAQCNLLTRKHRHYWAASDEQYPTQPKRRHTGGSLDKDFVRVPGVLRRIRPQAKRLLNGRFS